LFFEFKSSKDAIVLPFLSTILVMKTGFIGMLPFTKEVYAFVNSKTLKLDVPRAIEGTDSILLFNA